MPTPPKEGWNRLDMQLWDYCTSPSRPQPKTADIRAQTEAEWRDWITYRVSRAERNRLAMHAVDSARNQSLMSVALAKGSGQPLDPEDAALAPYGAEPDDFDWDSYPYNDNDTERGITPVGERKPYEQWFLELLARANRNRADGKKPTASRASDKAEDCHEYDYDIFMDTLIQQTGDGLVRDRLASDESNDPSQYSDRHEWGLPEDGEGKV